MCFMTSCFFFMRPLVAHLQACACIPSLCIQPNSYRGDRRLHFHLAFCRRINSDYIYKCGSDECIAFQIGNGCHACGETDCWRTNPKCKYKGKPVENHVDATQTGESAPDIIERSLVEFFAPNKVTGRVTLKFKFQKRDIELWKGSA